MSEIQFQQQHQQWEMSYENFVYHIESCHGDKTLIDAYYYQYPEYAQRYQYEVK